MGRHGKDRRSRVPPEQHGFQVNACKNPSCGNFAVPAAQVRGDLYKLSGGGPASQKSLICAICNETTAVKSNLAIAEEFTRISSYFEPSVEPCCPGVGCVNSDQGVRTNPCAYQRFGRTSAGSPRYRCKACTRLFSEPKNPTHRQRRPELNAFIFRLLVNKSPMRRICEIADASPGTVYAKLRYISGQCERFVRCHESKLLDPSSRLPPLVLSSDRQDYLINWGTSVDRRNIRLHGIGTADNSTGYVFGMHLDYDNRLDPGMIEADAVDLGDYDLDFPYRRYARLWLRRDWNDPKVRYKRKRRAAARRGVAIADVSEDDLISHWDGDAKLPGRGMIVRSEYTLLAHMWLLAQLTRGSPHVALYLDQDPGMRSASHWAFGKRILARTVDTFFVRIDKNMTIDEKGLAVAHATTRLLSARRRFPELSEAELRFELMKRNLKDFTARWQDRWTEHPFPDKSEPEKEICHLTDRPDFDPDFRAALHLYGSMHGIDRFFMIVRRRLSLLERPISTASSSGRVWHSGNPYRPQVVENLLTIIRVAYNFHWQGKDKMTPAMRLGLTDRPWGLEQILAGDEE